MKRLSILLVLAVLACVGIYFQWMAPAREVSAGTAEGMAPKSLSPSRVVDGESAMEHAPSAELREPAPVDPSTKTRDGLVASVANPTQTPSTEPEPYVDPLVKFRSRFEAMDEVERAAAFQEISTRLGQAHSQAMQERVKEGRADLVSEDEWSFAGANEPDVLAGGYTDGTNYYKVRLERFEEPDLFAIRDELRILQEVMLESAAQAAEAHRSGVPNK
ncbi:MAG: hypothetical protein H6830_06655 [Planctomycetes bacterium]|nr:hypothetical protein [Planctomycetota bacterium]MCB9911284.1 hypothetical protein [Planctomycetota bacterium]MCB9911547.1 hypothetical protein [Planctomycetota bacterium]HPF15077.1 hypothetical protein [Planctomycetota bacterium]HRV81957.1 hypothetical protein [Planctomycetota bacterium]